MSTTTDRIQPALFGGLVMGVLSALPIIAAGNLCCCLWVVSGGLVAAYLRQQDLHTPITAGEGALVGLLAGLVGAFVYLFASIPISFVAGPRERVIIQRIIENSSNMPPELREYARTYTGGGLRLVIMFLVMLFAGSVVSSIGGLLGAVLFGRSEPVPADLPPR